MIQRLDAFTMIDQFVNWVGPFGVGPFGVGLFGVGLFGVGLFGDFIRMPLERLIFIQVLPCLEVVGRENRECHLAFAIME